MCITVRGETEEEELARKKKEEELIHFWRIPEDSRNHMMLNEESYDNFVVDPSTGKLYDGKPWLLMFYKAKCGICKKWKPLILELSKEMDSIGFGFVDKDQSELLKTTYNTTMYPSIFLLKDGLAYQFINTGGGKNSLIKFIEEDHVNSKNIKPIIQRINNF